MSFPVKEGHVFPIAMFAYRWEIAFSLSGTIHPPPRLFSRDVPVAVSRAPWLRRNYPFVAGSLAIMGMNDITILIYVNQQMLEI